MDRFNFLPSYHYEDISGQSLNIKGSVGEPFRELKVFGESVQNGTPSPGNPIPVESVGERTRNLLDVSSAPMTFNSKGTTTTDTRWERTETGFRGSWVDDREGNSCRIGYVIGKTEEFKGKTITVSYEAILNQGARPAVMFIITSKQGTLLDSVDENVSFSSVSSGYVGNSATVKSLGGNWNTAFQTQSHTLTVPEDADSEAYPYLGVEFYLGSGVDNPKDSTFEIKNIQVEVGDTPTDYEPYGYKADIEVMGKNLLDIQNVDKTLIRCVLENVNNGVKIIATENNAAGYISINLNDIVTVGETYSISFVSERSGSTGGGIRVTIDGELSINMLNYTGGYYNGTFTAGTTNILMLYACTNLGYIDDFAIFKDIQVEVGDTATSYEAYQEPIHSTIYLKEPLRKIGNYADELYVIGEKATRNIFEYVFTGNETWVNPNGGLDTTIRSYARHIIMPRVRKDCAWIGFSEKGIFDGISTASGDAERCQFSNYADTYSAFYARILKSRCADPENPAISDFTNIYTPGTKVYGVRETPIEEPITLSDEISKTLKGSFNINIKTNLKPNIEASIYKY